MEHSLPQPAFFRPLGKGHLGHQRGFDPMAFDITRQRSKGRLVDRQGREALVQIPQGTGIKTGADMAGVTQLPLFVVHP